MPARIEPGDTIKLNFETDEGKCEVRTQIHLVGGSYFDAPVDYCKAKTLVIQDTTLLWKWWGGGEFGPMRPDCARRPSSP